MVSTLRPTRHLSHILIPLVVVALLAFTACGKSEDDQPASGAATKGIHIEFAFAGVPGDPYYTVIKNGASQAEKDLGVAVDYKETAQYDFQEQVRLIKAAIARKPDGLVVSEESPEVLDGPVKDAVDAGIPVIIAAAGEDSVKKTGALGFVGQNEFEVGFKAGEQLEQAGVGRVACLNPAVGTPNLDARCDGLKKVLGDDRVDVVAIDQTDRTSAKNRVKAILQRGDVDGLLALAASTVAEPALSAVEESGKADQVKLATIDLSPGVLRAVRDGKLLFASDQQQFLAGYLPVVLLTLYKQYGIRPPAFVPTGPSYVTDQNAAQVIDLSKKGIR
ncbi:MAG: simple sugar transport system substrate-binding protein [Thermoleophilaceae bacterium]|jgi:simple sugar transport system substrate-binding protein|nr:simple sugar transport system substrate-binding protein [Thermoleophilaceae bacterium]